MRARRLSAEAYRPYGDVVAAGAPKDARPANMGTARRWNFLAKLRSLRPRAKANLCLFRCAPFKGKRFAVRLLERHPKSTQVFLPMAGAGRFLAIVALGRAEPDLSTLAAFIGEGAQGITYRPGVWHHPMVALDRSADMACLVWEEGTGADCDEVRLQDPISVSVPQR